MFFIIPIETCRGVFNIILTPKLASEKRQIFAPKNDGYIGASLQSHMFIVMLDDTRFTTKFLQTNPTGRAFNLA